MSEENREKEAIIIITSIVMFALMYLLYKSKQSGTGQTQPQPPQQPPSTQPETHSGVDSFSMIYTDAGTAVIPGLHSGVDSFSMIYTDAGTASRG